MLLVGHIASRLGEAVGTQMREKVVRKHLSLPEGLDDALARRRLAWHLESPSRITELGGIASQNSFLVGLLELGLESIEKPVQSDRLWELLREGRRG